MLVLLTTACTALPPFENEDSLFNDICYENSFLLPDSLSNPVIEAKVLVNQKASHCFFVQT